MILTKKRITKALIRLRGFAGWPAPVLFAYPRRHVFSRRGLYESLYKWYRSHDQAINNIHIRQTNFRVRKGAKNRNRYNQVPHLIQDTNGKVTNESQDVSPFPAGDQKAQINRHAQRHNKYKTAKT